MSFIDKEDFDHATDQRINRMQTGRRRTVNQAHIESVVFEQVVKKNKNCGKSLTPFSHEDILSSERIVKRPHKNLPPIERRNAGQSYSFNTRILKNEDKNCDSTVSSSAENIPCSKQVVLKQQLENLPLKKKRETAQLFQVKRGAYNKRRDEQRKSSQPLNQGHDFTSNSQLNSKLETEHKVDKICEKVPVESFDSHEISDPPVAELKNNQDNFSNDHTIKFNNNVLKLNSSMTLHSLSITKKFSTNDGDVSAHSDCSSPSPDWNFFSEYNCSESNPFDANNNWNCTSSPVDFIPPPKPAPSGISNFCHSFDSEPDPACLSTNLDLNCDESRHVQNKIFGSPSIISVKLEPQVHEITSTISIGENQVNEVASTVSVQDKTAVLSAANQVNDVQSTFSSEDDQVVDNEQIEEIDQYLQKLEFEKSVAKETARKALHDLNKFLRYYFKGTSAKLYGSYWYDAAITTSNINLALVTDQPVKNNFLLHIQKLLAKQLKEYNVLPFEEELNPRKSKICFVDKVERYCCELIYLGKTVSMHLELNNLLSTVCDFDRRIKSLVIVTKLWAEACRINEVENGKLHSVGFILLVLHYLQQLEKPVLPLLDVSSKNWGLKKLPVKNNSSVGELWLDFLKYYSYKFNWNEYAVTVVDESPVLKSTKLWDISWIAIEDPVSKANIGSNVVVSDTAEYIISCFKKSYQYFISPPSDSSSSSSGSVHNEGQNSHKHGTFQMSDCISCSPPIFYSDCDEDSDCEDYYVPQRLENEALKFSKISDASLKCVNQVLDEVYNDFKLPDVQVKGRKAFVADLERNIRKIYPDAKLTLFGSTVNGFGFKRSDLDMCMTFGSGDKKNISERVVLKKLVYFLRGKNDYKNVIALYSAQIPIVKFNYIPQNWNCDLSLYNVLAVHNSRLIHKYSMMDEKCRILGCALKLLTKKTCIADCSSKTLSSYSYILMVIHFLQQVNPPVLPVMPVYDKEVFEKEIDIEKRCSEVLQNRNDWYFKDAHQLRERYLGTERNMSTVGELWLEMLEYYLQFDYERAVSITEKDPVLSSSLQRSARLINIEDPFISKRNLGCIVSERKAAESIKIFYRARMLFGGICSSEQMKNLQGHYFSPSNLTGRIMKDLECISCGGFGHETKECPKADPFKNRKPWIPRRTQKHK